MIRTGLLPPFVFTVSLGLSLFLPLSSPAQETVYKRGDANFDHRVDIADAVYLLSYFFSGGPGPRRCNPLSDANATGRLDISDAITILNYLFLGTTQIKPLTEAEIAECDAVAPVTVVRHGSLQPLAHEVSGVVEELSDRTIRITNFYYDGTGTPQVLVWLYKGINDQNGRGISPDLIRDQPYTNETIQYPIPADMTEDMFDHVAIYCTDFPLNYGYTLLFH